jgi:hypothetical protein
MPLTVKPPKVYLERQLYIRINADTFFIYSYFFISFIGKANIRYTIMSLVETKNKQKPFLAKCRRKIISLYRALYKGLEIQIPPNFQPLIPIIKFRTPVKYLDGSLK